MSDEPPNQPGKPQRAGQRNPGRPNESRPSKDELRRRLRETLPAATRPPADTPPDVPAPESASPKEAAPADAWLEWDKPDPEPAEPAGDPDADKKARRGNRGISKATAWRAAIVFAVILLAASGLSYWAGAWIERESSLAAASKERLSITPEFADKLDAALSELRNGKPEASLAALTSLAGANPTVASLDYLIGLAAMQAGNIPLAQKKLNESIEKRERISDSLAVLAAIEGQKPYDPNFKVMGDTRMRSEIYLNRAMQADAANPFPIIEMAALLRAQKRNADALRLLKSARTRLTPVDSHAVVDATIALLALEDAPEDQLPSNLDPGRDVPSAISAAYVAMRKGDFPRAAEILARCRRDLPPDLFAYLLSDPAFGKYSSQPALSGAFK